MSKKKVLHPDHSAQLSKLNRIDGQISGIKKMIEERRYCPDIIQQVRASRKALLAVEAELLKSHLNECVSNAFKSKSTRDKDEKIEEIIKIFKNGASQDLIS
jgi:DNA-binding FrmR family transcriptional regulator